jgi:glycopeptide antibiotics resistance protein
VAQQWIGPGIVIVPWLMAVLVTLVVARREALSSFSLAVAIVGISWVFAVVAASLFPFPLPPYSSVPLADGPFEHLPNVWLNPFPFHTIARATRSGSSGLALAVGNVIAYLPLGIVLGLVDSRARVGRVIAIALLVSGGVELLQLSISLVVGFPYRAADIDDVLLNVLGVVAGYAMVRLVIPAARTTVRRAPRARTAP